MKKWLHYFGYGTNRDAQMMAHMVGRKRIKGITGKIRGYELCIIGPEHMTDKVLKTAPIPKSARELILSGFGRSFKMYITRPKENGVTYGTVWKLTRKEYELVRNWELLEFGLQKEFTVQVEVEDKVENIENRRGETIPAQSHGFWRPDAPVKKVVKGPRYKDYIVSRKKMLERADEVRTQANRLVSKRKIKI